MNKVIWPYFLGNVLVGVKVIFLLNCPLVLSLHKHKGVRVFFNQKMRIPNRGSSLNNSIDKTPHLGHSPSPPSILRFHTYFTTFLVSKGSLSVSLPSYLPLLTIYKYWQSLDDSVEVSLNPSFFCALFFCLIFFFPFTF